MSRRCTGSIVDHALECPHLQWLNRGNHAASGRESSPPLGHAPLGSAKGTAAVRSDCRLGSTLSGPTSLAMAPFLHDWPPTCAYARA